MPQKIIEAIRLARQAVYALYFDVFRTDPERMAVKARAGVRDAFFITGRDHKLSSVTLSAWLSEFTTQPECLRLPFEMANDGVGSASYFHALAAICAASNPTQIVEFGTFLGIGTATMALNCGAQILTIDLPDTSWGREIDALNQVDSGLVDQSRNRVGCYYKGKPFGDRITELRCDSRSLDLRQHITRADLCLVDGGHSHECISTDTANAFRVIGPDGIIIWDDYFWLYPEVVKYLNQLSKTVPSLVKIKGTNLVVFRKSGSGVNGLLGNLASCGVV